MNRKNIIRKIIRKSEKIIDSFSREENPAKVRKKKARILGRKLRLKTKDYIFNNNGLKPLFYLPLYRKDYIQQTVLTEGTYYEIANLNYVCKKWEQGIVGKAIKGGCVLDIGANIGNHTLYFFFECGINRAICFEPIASTYKILKKNIKINQLENSVVLLNTAVGATEGTASVSFYDETNIGATKITPQKDGSIQVVSIDSLQIQDNIGLIKIDVEGFEKEVIAGCIDTIAKYRPYILIEIQSENIDHISKQLGGLGYRYIPLEGINYFFFM